MSKLTQEKQMSFEAWLELYYHLETDEGQMTLDDDLPDATDNWIANLTRDDLFYLSNKYGNDMAVVFIRENKLDI